MSPDLGPTRRQVSAPRMLVVRCPGWIKPADSRRCRLEAGGLEAGGLEAGGLGVEIPTFEPVLAAVEAFAPDVEIVEPGECLVGTRGPARYFGGEDSLVRQMQASVDAVLTSVGAGRRNRTGPSSCVIGVADGRFTARQAARRAEFDSLGTRVLIVPTGGGRLFLAPMSVGTLDQPEFADLLARFGVVTLGQLAALPPGSVLDRFGAMGARLQRLAQGLDPTPLIARSVPPDLAVEIELDPPAERVEKAVFVAVGLADRFYRQLATRGMVVAVVRIEAETAAGAHLSRCWRFDDPPSAAVVAERVRWQLDGWLLSRAELGSEVDGGITRLRLIPEEIGPGGRQLGFWGGDGGRGERAGRALVRVQAVLGAEAVAIGRVEIYGRGPGEQVRWTSWSGATASAAPLCPWPGRIPSPLPAAVFSVPVSAQVIDETGTLVGVGGRGCPTSGPAQLSVAGGPWMVIAAWTGPWVSDERWWDPAMRRRRARWQVVTDTGTAHLLAIEGGRWWLEATY